MSQPFQNKLKRKASGGTALGIKGSILHTMSISIPSLPEQKKIAQFLSALDAKIDAAHRQTEALQTIKKGFLQKMFI